MYIFSNCWSNFLLFPHLKCFKSSHLNNFGIFPSSFIYFFKGICHSLNYIFSLCILGHDVIAQAQSGTGKTATFVISILQNINLNSNACQALVLAPTRELAQQVQYGEQLLIDNYLTCDSTTHVSL